MKMFTKSQRKIKVGTVFQKIRYFVSGKGTVEKISKIKQRKNNKS